MTDEAGARSAQKFNGWITDAIVRAAEEALPASRWCNRYWLSARQTLDPGDTHIGPGVYQHGSFKTKEKAEISAATWMRMIASGEYKIQATIIHLGAFPLKAQPSQDDTQ